MGLLRLAEMERDGYRPLHKFVDPTVSRRYLFPQMSEHLLNTPSRGENGRSYSGLIGNEQEETSIHSTRPEESNPLLSDATINGEGANPTSPTNSPQLPHQSSTNNNHIREASSFDTAVDSKKGKWLHRRRLWCLVAMIFTLALGLPLGFVLRVRDFSLPLTPDPNNSTIQLTAVLVDVDPRLKTMTINWEVENAPCGGQPCEIYDIFFDNSLLVSNSNNNLQNNANNSIPNIPIFSIDSGLMNPDMNIFANTPSFTTEIALVSGTPDKGFAESPQCYPFDRYYSEIFIFAKNRNDSDGLKNNIPISIYDSWGIAAGFTTNVNNDSDNNTYIDFDIVISRGIEVRIYAVVIIIAIWMVTLVLLSSTISAIFLGHKIAKEVLLVPIATLFAFTSLRGTLPGAPQGFGAIVDYVGVLPCLAILTFCSVLHLGVFLVRDPEKDVEATAGMTWRQRLNGMVAYN